MSNTKPIISYQSDHVSVVVPVFNEADRIVPNINLLVNELEPYFGKFEVIVVSDGSTDGTDARLIEFQHPNVRTILNTENKGKGAALRSGFKAAQGDFIFFIDGGMELHPRELRIFFGLMALYDVDVVVGSKRHPQSVIYYPRYRKFLSWLYQLIVRALFKINVTDTQVGVKLFKRDLLNAILGHLEVDRYAFDLEFLSLASRFGFRKFLEAPIRLDYFIQDRPAVFDIVHVLRVGSSLLIETFKIYFRIKNSQKVEREKQKPR